MNWYVERNEWKYNLRAELHLKFVLKKKTFQRWALFYVRKKTKRVKTTISQIMFEKNFKRRILKTTFHKWKSFTCIKKTKKLKYAVADQYFNNNFKIERLRPYFARWTVFYKNQRILKLKMEESFRYYQTKLVGRVFNAFLSYILYRRLRKKQSEDVAYFYSNKLKRKMFSKLLSYKIYKCFQRDKWDLAENFYREKILTEAMKSFRKNLQRICYEKEVFHCLTRRKNERMKKFYFGCWKLFILDKKSKLDKRIRATEFFESHCKKKYFRKLKLYRLYRRKKIQYQTIQMSKIKYIFDKRLYNICFNNWRYFTYDKKIKKEHCHLAELHYESILKRTCFVKWFHYKNYRNMKKRKYIELDVWHYRKTLQKSFFTWRSFACRKRMFELQKMDAKKFYRQCLVRKIFMIMIKLAFQEKDDVLDNYLENEKRRLIIAQKYIKIWKTKSKNSGIYKSLSENTNLIRQDEKNCVFKRKEDPLVCSFIGNLSENFKWDPICFARPRVPGYMTKTDL